MIKSFKYCPNCGHAINSFDFRKMTCDSCGLVYYQNVAAAVAVILRKEDKILFTVRNKEPKKGMLDLAGGFTDPDESAERTCQREIEEELGITIPLEHFNYFLSQPNDYEYKEIPYKTCDLAFIADFPNEEIVLEKEEIAEVKWISIHELNLDEIGFDSLRKVVETYIKTFK
ncbi:NUDIX domain-containing protein [Empedobacter brevis]|uniref:NUDIX domain-containing protein n=1 Tax=Empedobacter brevis TaxID=247 RepID=A0AAJ1QGE6_9FLAO|nr:NUDIX domain-containing protein [Empedobacter brevis]MDM1073543.1 NUDIX domain-containing protein [Empedobacter brevis]QES92552.1 NUDIX domain-containing protein [Empedobacter brevis]QHC84297.1 NUDIX hydrolase [Empedobacter brevis]